MLECEIIARFEKTRAVLKEENIWLELDEHHAAECFVIYQFDPEKPTAKGAALLKTGTLENVAMFMRGFHAAKGAASV